MVPINQSQFTLRGMFLLTTFCSLGWAFIAPISRTNSLLAFICGASWTAFFLGYACIRFGAPPSTVERPMNGVTAIGIVLIFLAVVLGLPAALVIIMIAVRGIGS